MENAQRLAIWEPSNEQGWTPIQFLEGPGQ